MQYVMLQYNDTRYNMWCYNTICDVNGLKYTKRLKINHKIKK